jgi:diguanylate cyclase (GGDEF)-like protein
MINGGQLTDERVSLYRKAAEALREGQFDISIPEGAADEFAELGEALRDLAQSLKAQSEQTAELVKITQRVNEGLLIDEVLDHVYENFFSLIPYDRIGLSLLEEGQAVVRAHWVRSEATRIKLPLGYSAKLAGSSLARIIETGRPRILNDLGSYLDRNPNSDSTRRIVEEGMRSSLTCPLVVKGQPVGFLFFSSMKTDTYDEEHQALFLQIAGQLALTLEKGRIYQELLDTTEELREARDALETEATRDSLTGLWNRRSILDLLRRDMARAEREDKPLSAVMIDIDHFKKINDSIGHPGGDEVLQEVTRRVTSTLRSADMLGRIGGEEFLIILYPGDEPTAEEVMERARAACESSPVSVDAGKFDVTISLGAAVVSDYDDIDLSDVLKTADHALYRAKEGGRNCSVAEAV